MSLKTWSESKKPSISQSTPSPYLQPHHNNSTSPACQLQVGDKVQVNSLHGIVRFIGPTKFKAGTWAGIELDAVGLGKNDGSVDGKRYFVCPPKTGLFILAIKVLKQQQHLHLINRPSTPHNNISSPTLKHARALPPLPKKATLNNNELLQKRIEALETENRMLKEQASLNNQSERILVLEQSLIEVKKASMDSIEILENMVQSHQNTIHQLSNQLDKEKQKNQTLLEEQNDLRKAGLEAIESYESTLAGLEQQKVKSRQSWEQSQQKANKTHQREVKILLKDIVVLEQVLETRMTREAELLDSIKKERQNNLKLTAELKAMKFQVKINTNYNDNSRWSLFNKDRLDTPIEEVEEEEEEEDLLDDNILSICALCEKKGHHLIHCHMLTPTKK